MKRIISAILSVALMLSAMPAALAVDTKVVTAEPTEEDYTQYVDPFVGTDVDYGQLSPAAMTPYPLMKLGADTYPHSNDDHAGYDYSKQMISGFSHTRIEGVGGSGAGGDVLITPTYVQYTAKPSQESRAMNIEMSGSKRWSRRSRATTPSTSCRKRAWTTPPPKIRTLAVFRRS